MNKNDLRFFMDESSAPFEDDSNPFPRTKEDEEFERMIIARFHLITKEKEMKTITTNET